MAEKGCETDWPWASWAIRADLGSGPRSGIERMLTEDTEDKCERHIISRLVCIRCIYSVCVFVCLSVCVCVIFFSSHM